MEGPKGSGVWLCPQKNFQKINVEIAYFGPFLGHFCKLNYCVPCVADDVNAIGTLLKFSVYM